MNRAQLLGFAAACLILGQASLLSELHAQQDAPVPAVRIAGVTTSGSFSSDSRMLAIRMWPVHDFEEIRVFSVPSGRELASLPGGSWLANGFSPDGRMFASADSDRAIRIWRITPGEWEVIDEIGINDPRQASTTVEARRAGHSFPTFSPDGTLLAWDGYQGMVVWDVENRREAALLPVNGVIHYIGFSSDGELLKAFVVRRVGRKWLYDRRCWSASTFEPQGRPDRYRVGLHESGKVPNHVQFSPDGNLIAEVIHAGEAITVLDTTTGQSASCPGFPPPAPETLLGSDPRADFWNQWNTVSSMAFSPDNRTLAIGMNYGAAVLLWNLASSSPVARLDHSGSTSVWPALFSPDGRYLLTHSTEHAAGPERRELTLRYVGYLWDLCAQTGNTQPDGGATLP